MIYKCNMFNLLIIKLTYQIILMYSHNMHACIESITLTMKLIRIYGTLSKNKITEKLSFILRI